MKNRMTKLAVMAAVLILTVAGSAISASAQQIQLLARANKIINGIEAELRGDYRDDTKSQRLNAELENINIPVGTNVAFCLLQNGVKTLIGRGTVTLVGGIPVAQVELNTKDGDTVPTVAAGDVLQARQKKKAPFKANPTCGTGLLISAAFQ